MTARPPTNRVAAGGRGTPPFPPTAHCGFEMISYSHVRSSA